MDAKQHQMPYWVGHKMAAIIGQGENEAELWFQLFTYSESWEFPRYRKDGCPDRRYKPVYKGDYRDISVSVPLADALQGNYITREEVTLIPHYADSKELDPA